MTIAAGARGGGKALSGARWRWQEGQRVPGLVVTTEASITGESGVRARYSLGERPSAHYHKAALQYFRCFSESAITGTRTARCMKLPKAKTNKLLPGYQDTVQCSISRGLTILANSYESSDNAYFCILLIVIYITIG